MATATRKRGKTPARRCSRRTKLGKACRGRPLKGLDVCLAHADAKTRESVGFVARNGKQGRPPNPRAVDVLREKVEGRIEEVLAPLFDALTATRGVTIAIRGGGTEFYETADHPTRIVAAREILDRVYGKPTQHVSDPDRRAPMPEARLIAELAGLDDGSGRVVARVGVAFGEAARGAPVVEGSGRER